MQQAKYTKPSSVSGVGAPASPSNSPLPRALIPGAMLTGKGWRGIDAYGLLAAAYCWREARMQRRQFEGAVLYRTFETGYARKQVREYRLAEGDFAYFNLSARRLAGLIGCRRSTAAAALKTLERVEYITDGGNVGSYRLKCSNDALLTHGDFEYAQLRKGGCPTLKHLSLLLQRYPVDYRSSADLAKLLKVHRSRVSHLLAQLQEAGEVLVQRKVGCRNRVLSRLYDRGGSQANRCGPEANTYTIVGKQTAARRAPSAAGSAAKTNVFGPPLRVAGATAGRQPRDGRHSSLRDHITRVLFQRMRPKSASRSASSGRGD